MLDNYVVHSGDWVAKLANERGVERGSPLPARLLTRPQPHRRDFAKLKAKQKKAATMALTALSFATKAVLDAVTLTEVHGFNSLLGSLGERYEKHCRRPCRY